MSILIKDLRKTKKHSQVAVLFCLFTCWLALLRGWLFGYTALAKRQ
jgi:hypothetical protein